VAESQTLQRMQYASHHVQRWQNNRNVKELTQASKGFPVMLRTQGLAVAVATLDKDKKKQALAELVAHWLLNKAPVRSLHAANQHGTLVQQLLGACATTDRASYRIAQAEALALAETIKIYAGAWNNA